MIRSEKTKRLAAVVLLVLCGFACKSLGEPRTIKSKDGKFQITVPAYMSESPGLNKDSEITAANGARELYAFVLSKKKTDYADGQTLDEHTDILRNALMKQLTGSDATTPEKLTIDGIDARRYQVTGSKDGVKLAYVLTIIETNDQFHHIWSWTIPSKLNENGPILAQIGDSFRVNP